MASSLKLAAQGTATSAAALGSSSSTTSAQGPATSTTSASSTTKAAKKQQITLKNPTQQQKNGVIIRRFTIGNGKGELYIFVGLPGMGKREEIMTLLGPNFTVQERIKKYVCKQDQSILVNGKPYQVLKQQDITKGQPLPITYNTTNNPLYILTKVAEKMEQGITPILVDVMEESEVSAIIQLALKITGYTVHLVVYDGTNILTEDGKLLQYNTKLGQLEKEYGKKFRNITNGQKLPQILGKKQFKQLENFPLPQLHEEFIKLKKQSSPPKSTFFSMFSGKNPFSSFFRPKPNDNPPKQNVATMQLEPVGVTDKGINIPQPSAGGSHSQKHGVPPPSPQPAASAGGSHSQKLQSAAAAGGGGGQEILKQLPNLYDTQLNTTLEKTVEGELVLFPVECVKGFCKYKVGKVEIKDGNKSISINGNVPPNISYITELYPLISLNIFKKYLNPEKEIIGKTLPSFKNFTDFDLFKIVAVRRSDENMFTCGYINVKKKKGIAVVVNRKGDSKLFSNDSFDIPSFYILSIYTLFKDGSGSGAGAGGQQGGTAETTAQIKKLFQTGKYDELSVDKLQQLINYGQSIGKDKMTPDQQTKLKMVKQLKQKSSGNQPSKPTSGVLDSQQQKSAPREVSAGDKGQGGGRQQQLPPPPPQRTQNMRNIMKKVNYSQHTSLGDLNQQYKDLSDSQIQQFKNYLTEEIAKSDTSEDRKKAHTRRIQLLKDALKTRNRPPPPPPSTSASKGGDGESARLKQQLKKRRNFLKEDDDDDDDE